MGCGLKANDRNLEEKFKPHPYTGTMYERSQDQNIIMSKTCFIKQVSMLIAIDSYVILIFCLNDEKVPASSQARSLLLYTVPSVVGTKQGAEFDCHLPRQPSLALMSLLVQMTEN